MSRWFAALSIALLLLAGAAGGARAEYDPPKGLSDETQTYVGQIRSKAPPQAQPAARDAAFKAARDAAALKDGPKAVAGFEKAIQLGGDAPAAWLELSDAWMLGPKPDRARASQTALQSYQAAESTGDKARALWRLAEVYETAFQRLDLTLGALRAMVDIDFQTGRREVATTWPTLADKIDATRRTIGLEVTNFGSRGDGPEPRLCFLFSDYLAARARFEDFVKVEPSFPFAVDASDKELCVLGATYGSATRVTLRQGLPGEDGLTLKKDVVREVRVGSRAPTVAFKGDGFILPRESAGGVPISVVNVDAVEISIYRVNDRSLAPLYREGEFLDPVSSYKEQTLADDLGELVWKGRMEAPKAAPNVESTLALPFREAVPNPAPGYYVVVASPADIPQSIQPDPKATRWLLVSDIGLTTMEGADGVNVIARSISTAKPLAGAEVALLARNNQELARATTDESGRASFPEGLSRGEGGRRPIAVTAKSGADFSALTLTRSAFDLSDRGVGGRDAPGPMDAFVHTDRGVYRQGETVNLGFLLRDERSDAIAGMPLTIKILRPTGTLYRSEILTSSAQGVGTIALSLSKTAPLGPWRVEVYSDPKGTPIGKGEFQVDDFVPEKLAVDLTPSAPWIEPGKPFTVDAAVRFLYGAPGAGLDGSAHVDLAVDEQPFPRFKTFHFGLGRERLNDKREPLLFPKTDANGRSTITVKLPPRPDVTRPLTAKVSVEVFEPGGRPSRQSVNVPIRTRSYSLGVRSTSGEGRLSEGANGAFEVVAVAADGAPIAKNDLAWTLIREEQTFQWYVSQGRYQYRARTRDHIERSGAVTIDADKPATIEVGAVKWGRYRLEVADKTTGVASSAPLLVGWQPADGPSDRPDNLEITADKPVYRVGETARLRVVPPFAGEASLTIAGDRVHSTRAFPIPAEGTEIEIPVDAAWGPGAYAIVSAHRPPVKDKERQPVRALGLIRLGVDPAPRSLDVVIDAPDLIRPNKPVEVTLRVAPKEGTPEPTVVTLAAVDEGILRLTDFTTPDPVAWFLGKRKLGIDIRDDFGRLIDPLDRDWGKLRQGGDSGEMGLAVVPIKVVSLFRGPVEVGPDGTAKVTLEIPDFNGEIRLMAVAASKSRVGSGSRPMTVRDPVTADLIAPRFLAPGDESVVTINLHNVEGAGGPHSVAVVAEGAAVAVDGAARTVDLAKGARAVLTFPLRGVSAGISALTVRASGPGGSNPTAQTRELSVRPAWPVETRVTVDRLPPGQTAVLSAQTLLTGFQPGTASVTAGFGTTAPFDVAGLLKALDRYPLGCLEQTVSRALPLLSVDFVKGALGEKPEGDPIDQRVAAAIASVLDRQRYDGSFGLWSSGGETDAWVSAYAMDFLTRAKAKGFDVVDQPFKEGLDWLRRHAVDGSPDADGLAGRAYALEVLARAGAATPAPARYLFDAFLDKMPTPLAKGQLGAALARLGDKARARKAFAAALSNLARDPWKIDFGTSLRDAAALATLMVESGVTDGLDGLTQKLPSADISPRTTNTQERAWLALAAEALSTGKAPPKLTVGGRPVSGANPVSVNPTANELAAGLSVVNAGTDPVWRAISVAGVPVDPPPPAKEGFQVKRGFFTRSGETLNLDTIAQNDSFVMTVEGTATDKLEHRAAVTHLLPAGWEIEKANLTGGEYGDLEWANDLKATEMIQGRDDRVTAAVNLTAEEPAFKFAVMIRAVTPGTYALPGARVEDMYRSTLFARQPVGRITVHPPK